MKILRPKTSSEFLKIFQDFNNSGHCYYRGQTDFDWNISPGLCRNKNFSNKIDVLKQIETKIIDLFKERIEGNNLSKFVSSFPGSDYHQTWILLMAAQHYGLPTRLLDFSHDKFAALEFTVADLNFLDKDGALIIYENISAATEEVGSIVLKAPFSGDIERTFFFQAPSFYSNGRIPLSEHRKPIQGSKFLYRSNSNFDICLSQQSEHSKHLTKIQIPKKMKTDLIEHLIECGKMAYDLYSGKDENDFHAAIVKQVFKELNQDNIDVFLRGQTV
jgi:hypothetical protein